MDMSTSEGLLEQNPLDITPLDQRQRRFVVNLFVSEGKAPQVRSCEVQASDFRNRTSFTGTCGIDDVFEEQVAAGVQECLTHLSLSTKVLSLPEYIIETSGLILAGVHMMTTFSEDGTIGVILRFKVFVGGINNAFQPHISLEDSLGAHQERLSALVLSDISLPLLDLCAAAEVGLIEQSGNLAEFGKHLAERSHEIRFRIEMVKRYVDGLDRFTDSPTVPEITDALPDTVLQLRRS